MVISVHMLLVTVHRLRQSALACNQCVMFEILCGQMLSALPINTGGGI